MKRIHTNSFFSGILVSLLAVALIGTAVAAVGKQQIEVDYKNIKVNLNGEIINLTDASGNVIEPFAYNGTTYLPVRAISNALDMEVKYVEDKNSNSATVYLTSPSGLYYYSGFTIPAFESLTGNGTYIDASEYLEAHTATYVYDISSLNESAKKTIDADYTALLQTYGFTCTATNNSEYSSTPCSYYSSAQSGLNLIVGIGSVNDPTNKNLRSIYLGTVSYEYMKSLASSLNTSSGGTTSTPDSTQFSFPLSLYSNDGSVYLGKLVTSTYDTDGIWNTYGTYGSKHNTNSIWNEYGTYGSKYNVQSAFNPYTQTPPKIVDNNGKFFGYLSANEYLTDGYTITELKQYLIKNNQ